MPEPPNTPLWTAQTITGVGSYLAGMLTALGSFQVAKATNFAALNKRVSDIEQRADELDAKLTAKSMEALVANGVIEHLKIEIERLRWNLGQLAELFRTSIEKPKMTDIEKRHVLADIEKLTKPLADGGSPKEPEKGL